MVSLAKRERDKFGPDGLFSGRVEGVLIFEAIARVDVFFGELPNEFRSLRCQRHV